MVTRWSKRARLELQNCYEYIKDQSPQNAVIVRNKIIQASEDLVFYPERYPLDKYKINNKGEYRVFTLYHYRISYKIMETTILVVRMRHTSMSPLMY